MAHILRKYISNRGSALFMVISTMTALIISCMAMYFTMVSANSAQYAVFGQMQATQTADSVLSIVRNSLNPYNKLNPEFQAKLLALEEGESITTDANGFMALDPNIESGKTPAEIGAYSVTITCIKKEGELGKDLKMTFDYLVMSSFNGSRDAIHYTQTYDESYEGDPNIGEDGSGGDAELFAATGYVPNDAYVSGGYYLSDMFFDTQYTYMNTYGQNGQTRFSTDLLTGGDLMLGNEAWPIVHDTHGDIYHDSVVHNIGPVTWAVRGNFYINTERSFEMRYGSKILVGGNFEGANMCSLAITNSSQPYTGDATLGTHNSVYVNGDLTWNHSKLENNTWLFVNGKVSDIGPMEASASKIFVTDLTNVEDSNDSSVKPNVELWAKNKWPDAMFEPGGLFYGLEEVDIPLTYNEAIKELDKRTSTIEYYKWDLSANTKSADTQHVDIITNSEGSPLVDEDGNVICEAYARNFFFAFPGSESEDLVTDDKENGAVGKSFIIDSVWTHETMDAPATIVIDTGDDPNNIMTIKLSDVTGDNEFVWFADRKVTTNVINWYPYEATVTIDDPELCTSAPNSGKRSVLLKGRGTVLIDIPDGITYTANPFSFTGHVSWWLLNGGKIENNNGHLLFKGVNARDKISPTSVDYVHRYCTEEDDCNFDLAEITDENAAKCVTCNGNLTQVTCDVHGKVNKFCMNCFEDKKDRTDWCKNHVDNVKFDEFYGTISGTEKDWATGSDGEVIYPTTNFMLVSCDESAEMRFSNTSDGAQVDYNDFFGFIYAPYMTYLCSMGQDGAGTVKLCGGMTVGDYSLASADAFVGCYPDHMPNELAGMEGGGSIAGGKLKGVTKNWKITLGGYT